MLKKWDVKKLSKEFKEAKPFRHFVVEGLLQEKKIAPLLGALGSVEFHQKSSDLFELKQSDDLKSHKDFSEFHKAMKSLIPNLEKITGLQLNGEIDIAGTVYQDTDYLLCHDDQLESRKIAFIYYLTTLSDKEGGGLALYNSEVGVPTTQEKVIQPKKNQCMFFEVHKKSFHEVLEVVSSNPRIAIGGWFHGN